MTAGQTKFTNNPVNSDRDWLRIMLRDTAGDIFSDAMLDSMLADNPSKWWAAVQGANLRAAQGVVEPSRKKVGDLEISNSIVVGAGEDWATIAKQWSVMAVKKGGAKPYAGGISESDVDTIRANSDARLAGVRVGMMDFDAASTST